MPVLWLVTAAIASRADALEPIDGFLAPFRSVEVATAETGIVQQILIREGESVEAGQILARLDDAVYAAVLAEAEQNMRSQSRLEAAQAEHRLRQERLAALEELLLRGSARHEEVERARTDLAIAAAQMRSATEDRTLKNLEYQRAKSQWERRTICAPMTGVVVKRHKEEGEFIGTSDPQLLTLMQLDKLLATFSVPSSLGRHMHVNQKVKVHVSEANARVEGLVESVSSVIEGKSATMRVEVRIDNSQRRFLSGEPCSLLVDDPASSGNDQHNTQQTPNQVHVPQANGSGTETASAYDPSSRPRIRPTAAGPR